MSISVVLNTKVDLWYGSEIHDFWKALQRNHSDVGGFLQPPSVQDVPETPNEETKKGARDVQRLRKALSEKSAHAPPNGCQDPPQLILLLEMTDLALAHSVNSFVSSYSGYLWVL